MYRNFVKCEEACASFHKNEFKGGKMNTKIPLELLFFMFWLFQKVKIDEDSFQKIMHLLNIKNSYV